MSPGQNPVEQALDAVAKALVDEWLAELGVKVKFESASQICNYFKTGMISGQDAVGLIKQLGYTQKQALRMISLCYLRKLPTTLTTFPAPGTPEYRAMGRAIESTDPDYEPD